MYSSLDNNTRWWRCVCLAAAARIAKRMRNVDQLDIIPACCVCVCFSTHFFLPLLMLFVYFHFAVLRSNRQEKCAALNLLACLHVSRTTRRRRIVAAADQPTKHGGWPFIPDPLSCGFWLIKTATHKRKSRSPHSSHSNSRLGNRIEIQLSFWSLRINREWTVMLSLVCLYWLGLKGGQPMMVFNWVDEEGGSKKVFFLVEGFDTSDDELV